LGAGWSAGGSLGFTRMPRCGRFLEVGGAVAPPWSGSPASAAIGTTVPFRARATFAAQVAGMRLAFFSTFETA
jgi:hypothetical protein